MIEIKNQTLYDEHGKEVQLYTLRDMWKQEGRDEAVDSIKSHEVIGHYNVATKIGSIEFDDGFTKILESARKGNAV
jgi:hypothetical protein